MYTGYVKGNMDGNHALSKMEGFGKEICCAGTYLGMYTDN
jgi:hypothetical protein